MDSSPARLKSFRLSPTISGPTHAQTRRNDTFKFVQGLDKPYLIVLSVKFCSKSLGQPDCIGVHIGLATHYVTVLSRIFSPAF